MISVVCDNCRAESDLGSDDWGQLSRFNEDGPETRKDLCPKCFAQFVSWVGQRRPFDGDYPG